MLVSRLAHTLFCGAIVFTIFGSASNKADDSDAGHAGTGTASPLQAFVASEICRVRQQLDWAFAQDNIISLRLVISLMAVELNMIQFLPWAQSVFFEKSIGYPTMWLMRLCLATSILGASVDAIGDVAILAQTTDSGNRSSADAFIVINMIISLLMLANGLLDFGLKSYLLDNVNEGKDKGEREGKDLEGDVIPTSAGTTSGAGARGEDGRRVSTVVELADIYDEGDGQSIAGSGSGANGGAEDSDQTMETNPMHGLSATSSGGGGEGEEGKLVRKLRSQIEALQRRNQELEERERSRGTDIMGGEEERRL